MHPDTGRQRRRGARRHAARTATLVGERNGRDSADVDVSPGHRLDELALAVTPAVASDSRGGSSVVFDD
jgi:hypothetical protein